jgi:serine/threonine protein kinase
MMFHSLSHMPDDEVFRKSAAAPLTRRRLRAEAAALRRAAHPHVVRLGALLDLDDHTELHTELVDGRSLLDDAPRDGVAALELAATLAATVADLHEIGVVHGRLSPDHVLVRSDGRPVLCGFAEAGVRDPAADVVALATAFELLAAAVPRGRSRRDDRAVSCLIAAAEHTRTATPPPTAADLVRLLRSPKVSTRRAPRGHGPGSARRRRVALISIAALAAIGMTGLVATAVLRSFGGRGSPVLAAVTTTAPPTTAPPPSTHAPTTHPPTTHAPSAPEAAAQFRVHGATYAAGREGDVVVVGDWDCDGTMGAALLQPDDGDVYVFDRLAQPDTPVTGRLVATVEGAVSLEPFEQTDGCTSLAARHADGSPRLIATGAP